MTARLQLAEAIDGDPASPIDVVLADDHPMARRNLRLVLDREAGMKVVAEAENPTATEECVVAHHPRVLVLDLRLPNASSIAIIRRLRGETPDTEIVVVTMEESPAFALHALDAGACGIVIKDQADRDLPLAIRRAAQGEEYASPRIASALEAMRLAAGDDLSPRETEILRLISLGHTSAEIAQQLSLSRRTVETHRARVHTKLGLHTRAELVGYALGRHLIGN